MRIARNITSEVTEEQSATSDGRANELKTGLFSKVVWLLPSLMPPGTVVDEAKATVAMTEQDLEVLLSHSPPALKTSVWVSVKTSFAVLPSLLWRTKFHGTEAFTNCVHRI